MWREEMRGEETLDALLQYWKQNLYCSLRRGLARPVERNTLRTASTSS
jgi:hypothetical protein